MGSIDMTRHWAGWVLMAACYGLYLPSTLAAERPPGSSAPASTLNESGTAGNSPSVQASPGSPSPQTASDAPHNVPDLGLSPSQKQTIYESIHNQQVKKSAEP